MSIAVFILVVCLLVLADAFALYVLWTKISKEIKRMRNSINGECDSLWKRIGEVENMRSSEEKTSQPNYEPKIRYLYHKIEELNDICTRVNYTENALRHIEHDIERLGSRDDSLGGAIDNVEGDLAYIHETLGLHNDSECSINDLFKAFRRLDELKLGSRMSDVETQLEGINKQIEHLRAEYKAVNDRLLDVEFNNHYLTTVITSNGLKIKPDEKEDED